MSNVDITFDENYAIRILDPEVAHKSQELASLSNGFLEKLGTLSGIVRSTLQAVEESATSLEREKTKAISLRAAVEAQSEMRRQKVVEMQSIIAERKAVLERKAAELNSLLRAEKEQAAIIEKLSNSSS